MVRAEGLEPSLSLRKNGFSYPSTTFVAPTIYSKVWGLDYPFTVSGFLPGIRCCPSSLYTFPAGFSRAWLGIAILQVSPNLSSSTPPVSRRALKFSFKSVASADFATPARFQVTTNEWLTLSDF